MRIALFITCLTDTLFPETGKAITTVLERLGHEVAFPPGQACCGQMHFNSGYRRETVPMVRGFARAFSGFDAIVTPSASCAAMVREYHAAVAAGAGDAGLARTAGEIAPRVHDLSGLLVNVLGVVDVGAYFPYRVTYHPTCHSLRMLRVGDAPVRLLRAVRGLELIDLPGAEECCGFGGTFSVKFDEISGAMARTKIEAIVGTGANTVVSLDPSCLMQIQGAISRAGLNVRTMHLAEVLASR